MSPPILIEKSEVIDLRVPTSDHLLGSDPFHKKPNYSVVLLRLHTNVGLAGVSLSFTLGAGNDWLAYAVRDLLQLVVGVPLDAFIAAPGAFYRRLLDHHQLRWLADGVFRMAVGCVMNALWDLWAKREGKPLWKLLVDLPPETLVECVDWRYLRDALTPDEAFQLLEASQPHRQEREMRLRQRGPKAYSTAGWLGLSDEQIRQKVEAMKVQGFDCFKMKVGRDLEQDKRRLAFIRRVIGEEAKLMLDANQIWGVEEAIAWMRELLPFRPFWIEEPTARDDVLGYRRIAQALKPYRIGVAGGEQVPSPVIFKQLLASGALSYCQIDATRLGGVNDVLAVILMAAKYRIPVCPHGGGIGLCNLIQHYAIWDQICVAGPREDQFVEYLDFLQQGVFCHPVRVEEGAYIVPTAPGWGLEMHPEFVERHRYPEGEVWRGREASGSVLFVA